MSSLHWPDLGEIRQLRKASGLTQKQLSEISGVQQSIISRIEDGKILDPSFSTVRKLFETLRSPSSSKHQEILCAKDVMNKNVISISPHKTANEAWKIMKAHDFSQLPVIDEHGRIHGGVTLQSLPDAANASEDLGQTRVGDIASDGFPVVGQEATIETLSPLLRVNPAVLVMKHGKIVGIITKYDLIDFLYSKHRFRLI